MKSKSIKLTPKFLLQTMQGKATEYVSNLPGDAELLGLEYDLFSNQIRAVIKSDSFIEAAENEPTPELKLTYSTITGRPSHPEKDPESPIISSGEKIQFSPVQSTNKIEEEFTPEQRSLLSFRIEGEQVIVKPSRFLKTEWAEINETVRSLGGNWVKGDIISFWAIPLQPK